ncbi:MAG TPA: hypothetical protein VHY79_07665 [Rhizomicrobium sp.]|nr:hypothetical protein [Rhizomicrobium sp.]
MNRDRARNIDETLPSAAAAERNKMEQSSLVQGRTQGRRKIPARRNGKAIGAEETIHQPAAGRNKMKHFSQMQGKTQGEVKCRRGETRRDFCSRKDASSHRKSKQSGTSFPWCRVKRREKEKHRPQIGEMSGQMK